MVGKLKRNLLFLLVILVGILIAAYGEKRHVSYAGFLLVLLTWLIVQFVWDDKIRKKILLFEGILIFISMLAFYGINVIPFYSLYGETSRLIATQSNYYNPVSEYYLADNLIYTIIKDRDVMLATNAVWCKKYFEAISGKVFVETDNFEKKPDLNMEGFFNVGGMTLVINDDLFEKEIFNILRNKSNLEQYTNYPQLYISPTEINKTTQIYIFSDKDYNLYFMSYEVYLNAE